MAPKPTWAKCLEFEFFYLKRQGYIDITRTKINLGSHHCERDCHLKKIQQFDLKYIGTEETSLQHTLILFTTSRLQGHVKKIFSEYRISGIYTRIISEGNM